MGVTTMKMISNTSITSTIGVTLMSELTFAPSFRTFNAIEFPFPPCFAPPIAAKWRSRRPALGRPPGNSVGDCPLWGLGPAHAPALQEVVNQFARGVIHLHVERFHAAGQVVKHHYGRNRHEQSDGGSNERF